MSATTFYSYWRNAIIIENDTGLPSGFTQRYGNKGKNQSCGFEAVFNYSLNPFGVELGGSYVNSQTLDMPDPDDPGNEIDQNYDAFPTYSLIFGLFYKLKPADIDFNLNNRLYSGMKEAPQRRKGGRRGS